MSRRERPLLELVIIACAAGVVVWAFIRGDSNQEFAAFGIFIAICAFLVSQRPSEQLTRIERLLQRLVAAAETPKVGAVSQPGNWYIALDDGTGIEQHTEIAGDITLHVGIVFPNADDGHNWRVDHIDPVARTAHAVRAND